MIPRSCHNLSSHWNQIFSNRNYQNLFLCLCNNFVWGVQRHILPKHSDSFWLNCSCFWFYLQLESVKFCEVGKNNSAPVCAVLTVLCMFSLPRGILWNYLLVVSKIISFCKLETRSSHPQMTERFLNIFNREDIKRAFIGLCIHGCICVCSICIHQAKNVVLSRCLRTSQETWNTRHRALYRDILFMPGNKSVLATA